jgi:hypothetical protein
MKNDIIEKNLKKMLSEKRDGMFYQLTRESIGGNAGRYSEWQCTGANFWYNKDGEILKFTNQPNEQAYLGTFRIAVDLNNRESYLGIFFRILDCYFDKNSPELTNKVIEKSADCYNTLSILSLL